MKQSDRQTFKPTQFYIKASLFLQFSFFLNINLHIDFSDLRSPSTTVLLFWPIVSK